MKSACGHVAATYFASRGLGSTSQLLLVLVLMLITLLPVGEGSRKHSIKTITDNSAEDFDAHSKHFDGLKAKICKAFDNAASMTKYPGLESSCKVSQRKFTYHIKYNGSAGTFEINGSDEPSPFVARGWFGGFAIELSSFQPGPGCHVQKRGDEPFRFRTDPMTNSVEECNAFGVRCKYVLPDNLCIDNGVYREACDVH